MDFHSSPSTHISTTSQPHTHRHTQTPFPGRPAQDLVGASGVGGPGLSLPQRIVLGLGTAVLPYTWSRLCRTAHEGDWADSAVGSWRRVMWRAMRFCETAVMLAVTANSWVFLVQGDYRCGCIGAERRPSYRHKLPARDFPGGGGGGGWRATGD